MFFKERITEQDEKEREAIRKSLRDNFRGNEKAARILYEELERFISEEFFDPDKRIQEIDNMLFNANETLGQ